MNALRKLLWFAVQAALFVALVVLGGTLVGCGGGSDEEVIPRLRAPKWHRLLPGMFR